MTKIQKYKEKRKKAKHYGFIFSHPLIFVTL
jgi:hypothetical protein